MDLTNTTTRIPDTESETPPHSQSIKPLLSFPNGKNHHQYHRHNHQHPPPTVVVYKECLKNHAASIGGHALDGCGEFMPSPAYAPTEPTSLKCFACGCHRNFHRREPGNEFSTANINTHLIEFHRPGRTSPSPSPPPPHPPPPHPTNYAYAPHVLLSLSTAAADQNHTVVTPGTPMAIKVENPSGRKRFRTKFSQDQKDKMSVFAEKVSWKMQRCDEKMVADFCNEIGIKRGILKVWMHNNKNTFRKRDKDAIFPTATTTVTPVGMATATAGISKSRSNISNSGVISSEYFHEDNVDEHDNNSNSSSHQENGSGGDGGGGHLQASTNGSSSSS